MNSSQGKPALQVLVFISRIVIVQIFRGLDRLSISTPTPTPAFPIRLNGK